MKYKDKALKDKKLIKKFHYSKYKYGFYSKIKSEKFPKGINEKIIYLLSKKRKEPKWMYEWRLKAFKIWKNLSQPKWGNIDYKNIDFQKIIYYSGIKKNDKSIEPELKNTFKKLGIPMEERNFFLKKKTSIDFVLDSISVKTTFQKELKKNGIIFCSINEAIKKYPSLVKKYIGSVVPQNDNFYSALNSCIFSDGSFCYIPKGIKCPMELSTYFRINEGGIGQFERTLLIADENSYVSYLEGCTAPQRNEHQLHTAVVELIALKKSEIKYSTIQNWFPGKNKDEGVFNFVTKRGICYENSKISWTQIETGSAITWKYPSCILKGNNSIGEFYSISLTKDYQQADTGTKMIHIGKNTKSIIISKGISSCFSKNSYRGLVKILNSAKKSKNFSQCDSLLIGKNCSSHTFPTISINNNSSKVEHEAFTSKVSEEQIFYCEQRGIEKEKAISLIISGFGRKILNKLPMEFAIEAKNLLEISLENTIG